jgi:GNAT superfamily N-acetyltransferase
MPDVRAPHRIALREVRTERDPAFKSAHDLLRRTFHRAEMLSIQEWVQTLQEREADLWTDLGWHLLVATRHGRVVGAASGSYLGNWNVGVVGYIAVNPSGRGHGLGHRLRAGLRRCFEHDAWRIHRRHLRAIVGEVRADNPWLRRMVREQGAIALDFPYYQPSVRWLRSPVPLVLYYQPITYLRRSLPAADVRRLVYTIWRRMYRVPRPLSNKAFRRMLAALAGRERVGQMQLVSGKR